MSGPIQPAVVRWLLMPLILTTAGALAGGAWEAVGVEPRGAPGELLTFGAGLGLGASACLAMTRRRSLRLLLSVPAVLLAQAFAFAAWEAIRGDVTPDGWRWLRGVLEPTVLALFALPALVLVFCHATCETRGSLRAALLGYPLLLFATALVAVIPYGSWPHLPYSGCLASIGVGQALGMAAVLKLSRRLSPATEPAGPGPGGPQA